MKKLMPQIEFEFVSFNPFNCDARESLALIRTLSKYQRQVVERLMLNREIREIADEMGVKNRVVTDRLLRAMRKLRVREHVQIGRIWWSAMTLGVWWEDKYGLDNKKESG